MSCHRSLEDLESHVPLFADHESITELLEGSSAFGGSGRVWAEERDTPRTRTRFMSLDVTGSSPNPFLRRSLSNPKRSKSKGVSPLAKFSSPPEHSVSSEQVWVVDEQRSEATDERLTSSTENNLNQPPKPTASNMAQHLLMRGSSERIRGDRSARLHPQNITGSAGRHPRSCSAENLPSIPSSGSGMDHKRGMEPRSSSMSDIVRMNPVLKIPVIGIEEASDQEEERIEDGKITSEETEQSKSLVSSPPLPRFLNPDLAKRLSLPNEGSGSSLSTRTGSDSDLSYTGSITPDINDYRRSVGEKGGSKLRKSSLRKKSRPHDPNRHVQLALDIVKEEGTPPSSRKYKKRDEIRPKVQIRIGDDDDESEEEGDNVDSGRDEPNDNGYSGRRKQNFNVTQERFPINTKRAHEPHELFVQLDSWQYNQNQSEEGFVEKIWKEKARWIKFEEDWEEGSERWGKPHVASLTFNSLPQLRKGLENGLMLLDCKKTTLQGIFDSILDGLEEDHNMGRNDRMLISKMLKASSGCSHLHHKMLRGSVSSNQEEPTNIVRASIRRLSTIADFSHHRGAHQHQNQHNSAHLPTSRSMSAMDGKEHINGNGFTDPESKTSMIEAHRQQEKIIHLKVGDNGSAINRNLSAATLAAVQQHRSDGIIKKIPPDSEGALVMVAKEEYLEAPYMVLVRLDEPIHFENLLEVPIPLRYIFLVTGPPMPTLDYQEVGRALATLFSDEVFRNIAYSARERKDILVGINEFLNDTMVLPPGDWDKELLMPITRLQKREQEKVNRRRKTMNLKEEDTVALKQFLSSEKIHGDPLQRTGCLFGGLFRDVRRRYPHYLSDVLDSFNITCLAAFVFLYFACLSPAITFGGILGEMTQGWMGVSEMIISTSLNGIIFSLLSGQPLIIIGPTGPVLVFEENLLLFSKLMNIELLPFRAWIGIWTFLIATICVAVEGSVLVRHFTRFTEEIFALLISIIFIYETVSGLKYVACQNPFQDNYCLADMNSTMYPPAYNSSSIYALPTEADLFSKFNVTTTPFPSSITSSPTSHLFEQHVTYFDVMMNVTDHYGEDKYSGKSGKKKKKCYVPEGWDPKPNTTLMSIILTFGTFFIAFFIRQFRNSRFLGRTSRRAFGDIGIAIAITVMVTVSYFTKNVYLQKLSIGNGFAPTDPSMRGWFINPMGLTQPMPMIAILGASVPAFLVFILLYMETLLTGVIVNKKEHKLKKGTGFHLDLFIMGFLTALSGILGLPWMCAATVRTVSHVASLSVMTRTDAPGVKPRLDHIKDQRMTNFFVSLAIGLSLYMAPLLREVPIAVLLGVFLYLGLCSLSGLQMIERVKVFFMPSKHHPDVKYIRMVKAWKIHLFTFIQLVCLVAVWMIKTSIIAICFPFFFILLVAIRRLMRFIYTDQELEALDSEESEEEGNGSMADEYQATHMPV